MPEEVSNLGRLLVIGGVLLAAVGAVLLLAGKVTFLGRLPGDIVVERGSFRFYFPIVTSLLISALLTLAAWLFRR